MQPLEGAAGGTLDWPTLMRLGLGRLGMTPDTFWSMTPAELVLALEGAGVLAAPGQGPMSHAALLRLMAEYPD